MAKKHNKPTGNLTILKMNFQGVDSSVEKLKAEFPKVKDQTEITIIDLFINSISKNQNVSFNCDSYSQNNEQDLDFTINYNSEKSLLELTELVPNGMGKDGGYAKSPNWIDMNELTDRLIAIIYKKSENYTGINIPIDLLVYITDNNADLSMNAEKYMKIYLNQNGHIFRKIYFMISHPIGGIIKELFPTNEKGIIEHGKLGGCIIFK